MTCEADVDRLILKQALYVEIVLGGIEDLAERQARSAGNVAIGKVEGGRERIVKVGSRIRDDNLAASLEHSGAKSIG